MKPFHSVIGALRFVEDNAEGSVSVYIIQPVGSKKKRLLARKCEFNKTIYGWQEWWNR
jgi:hypothetical protein